MSALSTLCLAANSAPHACRLYEGNLLGATAVAQMRRQDALDAAVHVAEVRLGENWLAPRDDPVVAPTAPIPAARPDIASLQGTFGIVGDRAPEMRLSHEVTVRDAGREVRMKVPITVTQQQAQAALDARRAVEAKASPLDHAIDAGDVASVRRLVATGAARAAVEEGLNKQPMGWVARAAQRWHVAAGKAGNDMRLQARLAERHVAIIDALIEGGADPSVPYYQDTVLTGIPFQTSDGSKIPGTLELFRRLLIAGVTVDGPPAVKQPLEIAVRERSLEREQMILRLGHPSKGPLDRAFAEAMRYRRWEAVVRMLEAGADPNTDLGVRGSSALSRAMSSVAVVRPVVEALVAHGARVTDRAWVAAAIHDHELMALFLEHGADPDARDLSGMTPLHLAVMPPAPNVPPESTYRNTPPSDSAMRAKSVQLLLRYHADPRAVDRQGRTPLMLASAADERVLAMLVDAGGTVDFRASGASPPVPGPLSWALTRGNESLALALLHRHPELADSDCAAGFYAAGTGAVMVVTTLLDRGAAIDTVLDNGQTAFIVAARLGHIAVMQVLLDRHVSRVNERARIPWKEHAPVVRGQTALMVAAKAGREESVRFLVEHAANVNAWDLWGQSVLDYAEQSGNARSAAVVTYLREHGARRGVPVPRVF